MVCPARHPSEKYPFARSIRNALSVTHPRHSNSQPGLTGVHVIPHPPSSCCPATISSRFAWISCSLKWTRSGSSGKAPNQALSVHNQLFPLPPPTRTTEDACSGASFLSQHVHVAVHTVEMPTRIPSRAVLLAKYRKFSANSILWLSPARHGELHSYAISHRE